MNNIIQVNGYMIDARKIAMLDRKTVQISGKAQTGVVICFDGGGHKWVADPEAKAIEQACMDYEFGTRADYLPY